MPFTKISFASYALILTGLNIFLYYNINITSSMLSVQQIYIYGFAILAIVVGFFLGILF
jgi:hypothetical protein